MGYFAPDWLEFMTTPHPTEPNQLDKDITKLFITIDNYGTAQKARDDIKSFIAKYQTEARIDELSNILNLFDVEFAYYGGGKPFSNATGTVGNAPRIKKVVDKRLEQLKSEKTNETK